jgi:hypothetical protein
MVRNTKQGVFTYMGEEINFNYYTFLSTVDKVKFIKSVTEIVVGDNYYSVMKDLIFKFEIIDKFTDIVVHEVIGCTKDGLDIDTIEDFLNETNIVDTVKANVIPNVIEELEKAVDDNIEYLTGIHRNSMAESFTRLINTIEQKVSNIDNEAMGELAKIMNNISGDITMDKMLEAYSKSDLFKVKEN